MISFCKGKKYVVCCIIMLIPQFSLLAQTKTLSLQNVIDSALRYLPVLHQKQALIDAAHAGIQDVQHSFLPQTRFSEQLNLASANSLAGSYFTFGVTPSTSGSIRATNNAQVETGNVAVVYSEYELYNFGLNHAKLNTAHAYADLIAADAEKEKYQVTLQLAQLYLNILRQQSKLANDQQNVQRYQDIYTVIRALTLSGIKPGGDSSLAQAELSRAKISYNQTAGTINQLKEQLSYYTGIAPSALLLDTLHTSNVTASNNLLFTDTVHHPLIDYYIKRKAIYTANELLIKKTYLPKIILAGSVWARGSSIQYNDKYTALTNGLGYQRYNYATAVAFTYNLFNGIYKKDKLAINRYLLQASDDDLQQQKLFITAADRQADAAMQTITNNLKELPVQLQSAQDTYNQKTAQYKAGIISLIDLTNAAFVLYRSQTDYIETVTDWYQAQLNKAAATNNLIPFIQTLK
ncbi:MAG: TolC family protein [Bacteroidetes bacterium]|nr:TolC family protein [Bacteroidota bacterium]